MNRVIGPLKTRRKHRFSYLLSDTFRGTSKKGAPEKATSSGDTPQHAKSPNCLFSLPVEEKSQPGASKRSKRHRQGGGVLSWGGIGLFPLPEGEKANLQRWTPPRVALAFSLSWRAKWHSHFAPGFDTPPAKDVLLRMCAPWFAIFLETYRSGGS